MYFYPKKVLDEMLHPSQELDPLFDELRSQIALDGWSLKEIKPPRPMFSLDYVFQKGTKIFDVEIIREPEPYIEGMRHDISNDVCRVYSIDDFQNFLDYINS